MESLLAIGVGLVLRVVMDLAMGESDDRVGGVLLGLWEGVVLNHFVRRMPGSFDPYLGFGFRIFVDFLFTQSLSRFGLVVLWALVGMLLADITPNLWRDSGFRHLYRQVCRDVRHAKRSVPQIRIKNDLPSIRLFARSSSTSSAVSIRSDRASPSRSSTPSRVPTPGPPRRQGPRPPGTMPDVSGWSETDTSVSYQRERVVTNPRPSPSLIPSREHAGHEHIDTTHVATSQTRTITVQDTTVTVTQTQNESVVVETLVDATAIEATGASTTHVPVDSPSRHDPPVIPDDWVDINPSMPSQSEEPVAPFQPDPSSTLELRPLAGPSTLTPSRPISVLDPPPAIDVLPDIPDVDVGNRASQPPDQIPLPGSRAASVIGGVYDEPQPRSSLRDSLRSRVDKAASEIGVDPAKSFAPAVGTQATNTRNWSSFAASFTRSKLKQTVDADVSKASLKEVREDVVSQSRSDVGGAAQSSEAQTCTPAQVDPPASILTQPKDSTPLLLASVVPEVEQQARSQVPELSPADDLNIDSSSTSPRAQGGPDKGKPRKSSLFDLPSPERSPPPPFTEFAGVPEGPAAGEAPAELDPVAQEDAPVVLTAEESAAEEKRIAFLLTQVQELERSRADLQRKLESANGRNVKLIESDIEDMEKTLKTTKARMVKKKFSKPPLNPSIGEVSLANKSITEVQFTITSAILDMMLARDDAGPMTIQAMINKQKSLKNKARDARDALDALVKRHNFTIRSDSGTPGIVNITF